MLLVWQKGVCGEQLRRPRRADGHHLPPQQGNKGTFAKRHGAEGWPLLRWVPRRSQPRRAGGGGGRVRGRHRPSLQDGHPRRFLKAELFFARRCLLHTCYFVGKASSISHPVNEATAVAAPPAASVEENVSSQRFPCPALESRVPPLPSAARAEASLLAAEQVHKNDLIYYRRHVLKQLTKLQDVKRQASAFSFLNPYRLLAMIKIVFSFLKLELIFLSKAIM